MIKRLAAILMLIWMFFAPSGSMADPGLRFYPAVRVVHFKTVGPGGYLGIGSWSTPSLEAGGLVHGRFDPLIWGLSSSWGESEDELSRKYLAFHPDLLLDWKSRSRFFSLYNRELYDNEGLLTFRYWTGFRRSPWEIVCYTERTSDWRPRTLLGLGYEFGEVDGWPRNRVIIGVDTDYLQNPKNNFWLIWVIRF